MLKSEREGLKRQKRPPRANYSNVLTRPLRCVFYRAKSNGLRCFFKPAFYVGEEFLHLRKQTKRKLFTGFSGIRCEEYKGLLGANYANSARLASVGKLSRKTMGRAELTAKPKHNIKSFSKNQGVTVPLRLRALTNKVTK